MLAYSNIRGNLHAVLSRHCYIRLPAAGQSGAATQIISASSLIGQLRYSYHIYSCRTHTFLPWTLWQPGCIFACFGSIHLYNRDRNVFSACLFPCTQCEPYGPRFTLWNTFTVITPDRWHRPKATGLVPGQNQCFIWFLQLYRGAKKHDFKPSVMEKKKKKVVLSGNILQELDLSEWSNLCIMRFGLAGDTLWRTPLAISECRWTQLRKILDKIYVKNSLSLLAWVEITSAAWLPHYLFRYR